MKNNLKNRLSQWEQATQFLANEFIKKYFDKNLDVDYWWVGDEIGDVLAVADYYFDFSDIVDFIRYQYSVKDMFVYYDYALNIGIYNSEHKKDQKIKLSIYSWRKMRGLK